MYFYERKGIWYFGFKESSGKIRRISTGYSDRTEAEKFAIAFLSGNGSNGNNPSVNNCQGIKLSVFADEYVKHNTYLVTNRYIKNVIKPAFKKLISFVGDVPVNRIDRRNIELFIRDKFSKSKHTAHSYYRTLRAAFYVALKWKYINENPFTGIKLPKIPKAFPVFITVDELKKILKNTKDPLLQNIFIFCFYTGLRLGEVLNLKWNAVDILEKKVIVKIDDTFIPKGKKERIIPLNKDAYKAIRSYRPKANSINHSDYVFKNKYGYKLQNDFVSKNFKRAVRNTPEVNINIHFHSLRHSFASNLVQAGVSLYVVKELLGHEDIKTTAVYAHLKFDNLIEAVKLLR